MKLLEERIIKDGRILDGNIVKVDSFLNHQLDIKFLDKLAAEMANYFKDKKINKILTIEASVVFCKKQKTLNIGDDVYESKVESFTTKKNYTITVSKRFLSPEDNLLIIDDFLAEGNALKGLIDVANQAGATVSGVSVAIEKGFQEGGKIIRDMGYDLLSLAIIDSIEEGKISFR